MEIPAPINRLLTTDDEHPKAGDEINSQMRRARREEPVRGRYFERFKALFSSKDNLDPNAASDTIDSLKTRNRALAERLEALEDKSWEIRESEEIYRSLAEAFGDIIIHRNQSGAVVFSNGPYSNYFNATSVLPDIEHETNQKQDNDTEQADTVTAPLARDVLIETLVGSRWFSWTDLAIRDPQTGQVGWRSVARDITERKLHENALRQALDKAKVASEAKSRFLAMVSHEIRTPLNGVIGMAGLLESTQLTPSQNAYVKAIDTSGQTLLSLIEDLLDTSRIESGHLTLTNKKTILVKLIEDVAEILAPKAREKGLAFATHIAENVPIELNLDAGRLRQVLLNIAGNAVKFTASGGVSIEVDLAKEPALRGDQCRLTFSITDSGPGLDKKDHAKIFEEFVQTETGATRQFGGAGLGLSISQKITSQMGGDISVQSEPGSGAKFVFSINADVEAPVLGKLSSRKFAKQNVGLILAQSPARDALMRSVGQAGRKVVAFDSLKQFLARPHHQTGFQTILIDQSEFATIENSRSELMHEIWKSARIISIGDQISHNEADQISDGWLTWPIRAQSLENVLMGTIGQIGQTEPEENPMVPTSTSLRILLAEDNPINALLAKSLLINLGHDVTHVENGEQAIKQVTENSFELIFMDLHMPVMDGISAIRLIREGRAGDNKKHQSIIVLSADGQDDVRQNALDSGADDYLTKPLDLKVVADVLENMTKNA